MDWAAIFTGLGVFALYLLFGIAFYTPFILAGDISDHERRERVDPFPTHGPNNTKNEGLSL